MEEGEKEFNNEVTVERDERMIKVLYFIKLWYIVYEWNVYFIMRVVRVYIVMNVIVCWLYIYLVCICEVGVVYFGFCVVGFG